MSAKPKEQTDIDIFDGVNILDAMMALATQNNRLARTVRSAVSAALDELDKREWRASLREADSRWVKKGDRRSIESVEKGKKTVLKSRRRRARQRGDTRRAVQSAELGARRFPREMAATAVVLLAMEPGRWYLRGEIRATCPELPEGSVGALLGQTMLNCPALVERALNSSWDGLRGSLRAKGADTSAERRSQWRYRLTAVGEAARAEIMADPTRWTAIERWKTGLSNAAAVPQPHSCAASLFYGRRLLVDRHHLTQK